MHPFTDSKALAARGARVITHGQGIYIYDSEGKKILDAMSGLWCVNSGYGRKELAQAAYMQMLELPYYNSFFNTTNVPAVQLATKLTSLAPKVDDCEFTHVFFSSSGSESNDTNIRMVRHYWATLGQPQRQVIISRKNGYHGSTVGGSSLGGMSGMHAQGGVLPGIEHIDQPYWFENAKEGESEADFGLRMARQLEEKILQVGADKVAAFIGEPVQGAGGVIIPPASYWPEIQRIVDKYGILLISDEVICAFGRLGAWFAYEQFGYKPDLITFAKGVTSGYIPLGGVMVGKRVADVLINQGGEFNHGYTYSGHPAACAVALANLELMEREGVIENVRNTLAPYLKQQIATLMDHPLVGEAKTHGMVAGLLLVKSKAKQPGSKPIAFASDLAVGMICRGHCFGNGLVMRAVGDRMIIAPPLVMSLAQIDEMMGLIRQALDLTWRDLNQSGLRLMKKYFFAFTLSAIALAGCGEKKEATPAPAPAASAAAPAPAAPALDSEKVLNIYNWPDYVAESLIPDFEKETGIKVNYQTFENNEALNAKLVAGNTGFDIVVPGSVFAKPQIDEGLLQPLDKALIPNYGNLDTTFMGKLTNVDADNKHLIPWAWGFTTVGINKTKVEKALAGMPMPENAWDLVFNPQYTKKLKSCGIAYLDSPTEVIPPALHYLGKNAYSNDPADYKAAGEMLAKVSAMQTNEMNYPTGNQAAMADIKPEIKDNPTIILDPTNMSKLVAPGYYTNAAREAMANLVKRFDEAVAVDNVSLNIGKGEIFALLGSSGCGKSTLLRMLAGFEKPTSGKILLAGKDVANVPPYDRPVNMMFQSYALFPHMDVWENIAFGLKREGLPKEEIQKRVGQMLDLVQLTPYAKRKPYQLSGGQQQRVALARSLAKKPQLLLLDEPLGALDKKLREQTQFELVNIIESVGVTVVMVTHDQEEAMTMASRIAIMSKGRVLQVGTPREVYEFPQTRFVADFIGNVNLFDGKLSTDEPDHCVITTNIGMIEVGHGVS
ncbi:unnamed protein product, partial [Darwinula stevensoni]